MTLLRDSRNNHVDSNHLNHLSRLQEELAQKEALIAVLERKLSLIDSVATDKRSIMGNKSSRTMSIISLRRDSKDVASSKLIRNMDSVPTSPIAMKMYRQGSIISKLLGRRKSKFSLSDIFSAPAMKDYNQKKVLEELRDRYGHCYKKVFEPRTNVQLPLPTGQIKQYSYSELMEGRQIDLLLDHLEWHLKDEELLECLGICKEFLEDLDPSDLYDRKYRAMLTKEQYLTLVKI